MKKSRISKRNRKYLNGNYWMGGGMGVCGFAWTLLLIGTGAAAETDRPVLWLLVGPVPFVVGFAAVAFLRQRRLPILTCQDGGTRERTPRSGLGMEFRLEPESCDFFRAKNYGAKSNPSHLILPDN